jgi:Do/DeqQ family serine protease
VLASACERINEEPARPTANIEAPAAPSPPPAAPPTAPPLTATPTPAPAAPTLAATDGGVALPDFTDLVRRASPSVVNIYTKVVVHERPQNLHPFFPMAPRDRLAESLGTGFIVDERGTVVTNNHVIDKAAEIRVRTSDNREFAARIIGADPRTDIAVIELIDAPPMTPLPLGDSDKVEVGQWALAIGNALGLSSTVTKGIISAKGRSDIPIGGDVRYVDFLQTDASINPGNSGGPLINMRGEVIGINTAISREGQGIGFAIPINMAREIIPQLRDKGKVSRSWLGIYVGAVDEDLQSRNHLDRKRGAVVTRIVPGGPAEGAGVQPGDVIVRFDGEDIEDIEALRWKSSLAGIGRKVQLDVLREGNPLALTLALTKSPYE